MYVWSDVFKIQDHVRICAIIKHTTVCKAIWVEHQLNKTPSLVFFIIINPNYGYIYLPIKLL